MPPHTPGAAVMQATEAARAAGADLIVTVGGGSITDGAKAVQMCLANDIRSPDAIDMLRSALPITAIGLCVAASRRRPGPLRVKTSRARRPGGCVQVTLAADGLLQRREWSKNASTGNTKPISKMTTWPSTAATSPSE
jgi:hypothetical protein